MKNIYKYNILFVLLLFLGACSVTKYVPDGKYLLKNASVKIDDRRVPTSKAEAYMQQKPNTKSFGLFKTKLRMYNLSGRDEHKGINKFFRNLGEAPVIYDSVKTQVTEVQLKRFMENRGFYNSKVEVRKKNRKKKVEITYHIQAGEPKKITQITRSRDSLNYKVIGRENMKKELLDSSELRQMLIADQKHSVIKKGKLFDIDFLKKERQRLEQIYKEKGYFFFNENNIHFYIDTTHTANDVVLHYGLRSSDSLHTRKYKIRKIFVRMGTEANCEDCDTIQNKEYDDIIFTYRGSLNYKPQVLANAIVLQTGEDYDSRKVEETKARMARLQQFQFTNITFNEYKIDGAVGLLDCYIYLMTSKKQSYGVEATATANSGDYGFTGTLRYNHKNLFKGAELFTTELSTGIERISGSTFGKFDAKEYGFRTTLVTPKFLIPFLKVEKWRKKSPSTSFSILFNHSDRPEYLRTISDVNFSYRWASNPHITHTVTPLDIGVLKVRADVQFLQNLNDYYRQTSYVDHIITSSRYMFNFNNMGRERKVTYQRFRFTLETAGNILKGIDKIFNKEKELMDTNTNRTYSTYFDIRYAQYVRSDVDFTYNQFINDKNAIVYHIFAGVGVPYGNSNVMPFEKMYFAGGPNSMRGWSPRSLGPGVSKTNNPKDRISYGEVKLEANLEYRFGMSGSLEGAFFIDAGNVWNISDLTKIDKAGRFEIDQFYKQLAVGTGLGLRVNITNIILRFDLGLKVIDPYYDKGQRFIPIKKGWKFTDINFNFGIGYPF